MLFLKTFGESEHGATVIEYAIVATFVSIAIIAGAALIGGNVNGFFTSIGNAF